MREKEGVAGNVHAHVDHRGYEVLGTSNFFVKIPSTWFICRLHLTQGEYMSRREDERERKYKRGSWAIRKSAEKERRNNGESIGARAQVALLTNGKK